MVLFPVFRGFAYLPFEAYGPHPVSEFDNTLLRLTKIIHQLIVDFEII